MKDHYIVLRNKRGIGWVAEGTPMGFKCARNKRDKLRSQFGRGQTILVKVVE